MQTNPNEDTSKETQDAHNYDCQCTKCREKYGYLPLLIKVMEENEKETKKKSETQTNEDNIEQPTSSRSYLYREMICVECDKKFSHRGDYNKHLRKHTGEQPYKCEICHKKFAHTSNLSRHLKLHTGIKQFTCDACNKKFSRKDKLLSHQKSKSCRNKTE